MALSKEPAASVMVWAQHSPRCLLAYFLAPGTTWSLQFKDVIDHVLRENRRQNDRKRNESTSSLRKCCNRRTQLCGEFDAVSKTMEALTDTPSCREMEQRLNTLQTSLNVVERSITKFKNLIEDCWMLEEEVHHIEEDKACLEEEICQQEEEEICQQEEEDIHQEEEEEEIADVKMVKEEESGDPESSGPRGEANTEGLPPLVSTGDAISLEEDALLMQPAPQPEDPAAGSHSPRSETGTVSGGMAELCLTSLSHPGTRRMRPHHRSLPFSITV